MTKTFRDNLIYLTVGLGIAALVAADFFFAERHGRKMWMPSRFAFRLAYTTALGYFVVRETLKAKATAVALWEFGRFIPIEGHARYTARTFFFL